jgi:hypothetical protein
MRRYIDEYFELPIYQRYSVTPEKIKEIVVKMHDEGSSTEEIVEHLQEELYLFLDDEETSWETTVVNNIIENKPVLNRFTNIEF